MLTHLKQFYKDKAIICTAKQESAIMLKQIFEQAGISVIVASTLYDAERLINQEMPYLVVTESLLSDGDCGVLFDRVRANSIFSDLPFFAIVTTKTKEALSPLLKRKFSGVALGDLRDAAFINKLIANIQGRNQASPYFFEIDGKIIADKITLATEATILGKMDNFLVSKSLTQIDTGAHLLATPKMTQYSPVMLHKATNILDQKGNFYYNLFPCANAMGQGLKWISTLPQIVLPNALPKTTTANLSQPITHRVLFFVPSKDSFDGFYKVFKGYHIELVHATNLNHAINTLSGDFSSYHAIYLHELLAGGGAIQWNKFYNSLDIDKRPPVIIATESMQARSSENVYFIRKPFGLGAFLNLLKATFIRNEGINPMITSLSDRSPAADLQCSFETSAKLIGLDETGGILRLNFPVFPGSKLRLNHAILSPIWGDQPITISHILSSEGNFLVKFDIIDKTTSRRSFWEKIKKTIGNHGTQVTPAA